LDVFHRPFRTKFRGRIFQPLRSWLISGCPAGTKPKCRARRKPTAETRRRRVLKTLFSAPLRLCGKKILCRAAFGWIIFPHRSKVEDVKAIIISALSGGLAGALFTNWMARRNRRRAFRSYIKSFQCDLGILMLNWKHIHSGNPYFLYDWQKEAAVKIASKCAQVLEDIPARHHTSFMDLLMQFARQERRDVEPYEGKQEERPLLFSDQQKKFSDLLDKMIKYAR
jgi:hypothetical protein